MKPLCPDLYEALEERFGAVKVINEGEEIVAHPKVDPATGNIYWDILQKGEHYFVNCPFCNDTRQRLGISYTYGQVDPYTLRAATWLAHCFNEECLSRNTPFGPENRRELEEMVFGFVNREDRIGKFKTEPGYVEPQTLTDTTLPGRVITLDRLIANHPAVQYLEARGYDAARLGRKWGVGYCVEADMQYPAARGRIIIPIVMDGRLVGWQGRYVGDLDWKAHRVAKYYNLPRMAKRLMLYNIDNARKGRIVVVVEGVTGVWAIGDAAVAVMGHDISSQQQDMIIETWARKGSLLVIMLDPDAAKQANKYYKMMENTFLCNSGAIFKVHLPDGKDPGDYDRAAVWDMIYAAGDIAGIDVSSYI